MSWTQFKEERAKIMLAEGQGLANTASHLEVSEETLTQKAFRNGWTIAPISDKAPITFEPHETWRKRKAIDLEKKSVEQVERHLDGLATIDTSLDTAKELALVSKVARDWLKSDNDSDGVKCIINITALSRPELFIRKPKVVELNPLESNESHDPS